MALDDNPIFARRTRLFGHRAAMHAWLWERPWGKLAIAAPALFWLGFLLMSGVQDRREASRIKPLFLNACITQHDAKTCDDALATHHLLCFNVAQAGTKRDWLIPRDEARYVTCMTRRMAGLTPTPPRPRAE